MVRRYAGERVVENPSQRGNIIVSRQDESARFPYRSADLHFKDHCAALGVTLPAHDVSDYKLHKRLSLDNVVRPQQQRRRDSEAERLRGLHVNDQFELGWRLYGQLAWLSPLGMTRGSLGVGGKDL